MGDAKQKRHISQPQFKFDSLRRGLLFLFRFVQSRIVKLRRIPAIKGFFIQCVALLVAILISTAVTVAISRSFGVDLHNSLFALILLQALLAAIFSQLLGMASWWRWIHFCFPFSIWWVSSLHISNSVFLVGFVVSLSLFWTTFRTQVPYFPSTPNVWFHVSRLIPGSQNKSIRMIDIGSGFGGMSMHIAQVCPHVRVEGMEIAPLPWIVSVLRARISRSSAVFKLGDYEHLNFVDYDVVFAYLSPVAMQDLWRKARKEMRHGSLLISYEFDIVGVTPMSVISVGEQRPMLYVWKIE